MPIWTCKQTFCHRRLLFVSNALLSESRSQAFRLHGTCLPWPIPNKALEVIRCAHAWEETAVREKEAADGRLVPTPLAFYPPSVEYSDCQRQEVKHAYHYSHADDSGGR